MVTVDNVKTSLRIDHSMDDTLIEGLIGTASYYIISAIDSKASEGEIEAYKQFDWCVSLIVQHWYINRQEASVERIPMVALAMIQQMRGAYYATH